MDVVYSPVAVLSTALICTVISVANEVLRNRFACTSPPFSLIIYTDWLKLTDTATEYKNINTEQSTYTYVHY